MNVRAALAPSPPAGLASARASLYRLLAEALSYPDAETAALVRGAYLDDALDAVGLLNADIAAAVRALRRALAGLDAGEAERAFVATFGHARPQVAVPYECPYVTTNLFQESDTLADIAGFYRAFGVEPGASRAERHDHIVLELEFMYLLTFKEAGALGGAMDARAEICRDAQRSFLAAHLGRWGMRFFEQLEATGAPPYHAAVAHLGAAFMRYEAARFDLEPERTARPVLLPDEADASCPLAPGGEP
ncbi:MAG: molecular chaperone TorD family protein [Chloroflexota bacterium]